MKSQHPSMPQSVRGADENHRMEIARLMARAKLLDAIDEPDECLYVVALLKITLAHTGIEPDG